MNNERSIEIYLDNPASGWSGLLAALIVFALAAWLFFRGGSMPAWGASLVLGAAGFYTLKGLLTLEPNESAALTLFGNYVGTVRRPGFFFLNPFYSKRRISLRVHNFNTPTMKVNDAAGNPIEVAAVVTWRVADTAQALFDVESYADYIHIQSEMSLRDVISQYAYDGAAGVTLRGNVEAVAARLAQVLQAHLELAGINVLEARLTHLAYAPEIAGAMLKRQQAEAIVSARETLVEGAVGMVQMALEQLSARSIATLDARERAVLVTSMMTVLISDSGVQPTVAVASAVHGI